MEDVPIAIELNGKQLTGFAVPLVRSAQENPRVFDIIIDKAFLGTLHKTKEGWTMDTNQDPHLVAAIGCCISAWYDAPSHLLNSLTNESSKE